MAPKRSKHGQEETMNSEARKAKQLMDGGVVEGDVFSHPPLHAETETETVAFSETESCNFTKLG